MTGDAILTAVSDVLSTRELVLCRACRCELPRVDALVVVEEIDE